MRPEMLSAMAPGQEAEILEIVRTLDLARSNRSRRHNIRLALERFLKSPSLSTFRTLRGATFPFLLEGELRRRPLNSTEGITRLGMEEGTTS